GRQARMRLARLAARGRTGDLGNRGADGGRHRCHPAVAAVRCPRDFAADRDRIKRHLVGALRHRSRVGRAGAPPARIQHLLYRRRRKSGEPLILMISKRRSKKWGIPKGKVDPYLNFGEAAAKEAFEEAGLIGQVSPHSIGVFRMRKRSATNPQVQRLVEVWIYLLEVTETLTNWPEKGKRKIKWVSCEAATRHLREPLLAQ